jgi:hypothetical protein
MVTLSATRRTPVHRCRWDPLQVQPSGPGEALVRSGMNDS